MKLPPVFDLFSNKYNDKQLMWLIHQSIECLLDENQVKRLPSELYHLAFRQGFVVGPGPDNIIRQALTLRGRWFLHLMKDIKRR